MSEISPQTTTVVVTFLADHLWQSILCVALLAAFAALTRHNAAVVRLWIWRIAAVKLLLPFTLLQLVGGWFGFPARFPGDPPPEFFVEKVAEVAPWFSAGSWFDSTAVRLLWLLALLIVAVATARAVFGRIHREARNARVEELRLEADPDDREPGVGFTRAALMTACTLIVLALPLLAGAVRASAHAYEVLVANTETLTRARVTLRPAKPGLGSRYFVDVTNNGVTIQNITVRELTGMAYGVNRFYVRGKHFRDGDNEDWLVDTRHDVRIEGSVIEPGRFDTYALRYAITRELAKNFGLEIYVNSECQKPCGKWGDRKLIEVAPDSWRLVSEEEARALAVANLPHARRDQPALSRFVEFLAAFNTGSSALAHYLEMHISVESDVRPGVEQTLALLDRTGGLDVVELKDRSPNVLSGLVRERKSRALLAVSFYVEAKPPHRIANFRFEKPAAVPK